MSENIIVKERIEGTGTWGGPALVPDSVWATASYNINGRTISMPVQVAGDHITAQVVQLRPAK